MDGNSQYLDLSGDLVSVTTSNIMWQTWEDFLTDLASSDFEAEPARARVARKELHIDSPALEHCPESIPISGIGPAEWAKWDHRLTLADNQESSRPQPLHFMGPALGTSHSNRQPLAPSPMAQNLRLADGHDQSQSLSSHQPPNLALLPNHDPPSKERRMQGVQAMKKSKGKDRFSPYSTSNNWSHSPIHRDLQQPETSCTVGFHAILELTKSLLHTKSSRKSLLMCRGEKAQWILDIMQKLLDHQNLDAASRRFILGTTLRLCKESGGYPACLTLQGVRREGRPVTEGKFGEIWRGDFQGEVVCMKVVKLYQRSQVERLIKSFAREAIMWSQLSHPNLLPFYGIYQWDDRVCLVSPWMSQGNISEYLKANTEAPRQPLIDDILSGLAYLHDKSIVHGDLKGVNIMITSSGTACLADFGLSSVVDADILRLTSLETTSWSGGTLRWEAPELIEGSDENETLRSTFSADVYSLASVMYEVLTGRIPYYEIPRDATVIKNIISGINPSKPLPDEELELTDEIWEVMEECWSRTPADRPTVANIIEDLRQIPLTPLTMARLARQQTRKSGGVLPRLTASSFRVAMRGGNQAFTTSEFRLLEEMMS